MTSRPSSRGWQGATQVRPGWFVFQIKMLEKKDNWLLRLSFLLLLFVVCTIVMIIFIIIIVTIILDIV